MEENKTVFAGEISVEDALYKIYAVLTDIKTELENIRVGM